MAIVVGVPVRAAPLRVVQPPLAKNPGVRSLRRGVVGRGSCDPLRAPCSMSRKMLTPRQSWSGGGSGRETIRDIYYQAIRVFCTGSMGAWVEGLAAT